MKTDNSARPVTARDVEAWRSCVGREIVQHALADSEVLRRFALASGSDPEVERAPPALSHWGLFSDAVADDRIGPDGHPGRGDFWPDVFLPRRMFAGAELSFSNPLQLGAPTRMVSTISSVEHKLGRSGDLVFVKVQREVTQGDSLCVVEEQTIVYRPQGEPLAPIEPVECSTRGCETWTPGPVQLFRFSAVTYNSHRIHYDLDYASGQEGYPGLVVHGPFTAVKLLDYACSGEDRPVRKFRFRGLAPLFASQQILLSAGDEQGKFLAIRCDGNPAMVADVQF